MKETRSEPCYELERLSNTGRGQLRHRKKKGVNRPLEDTHFELGSPFAEYEDPEDGISEGLTTTKSPQHKQKHRK